MNDDPVTGIGIIIYHYLGTLPGGYSFAITGIILGFIYGLYCYIRSLRYLYYYYIEYGALLYIIQDHKHLMNTVIERYQLSDRFTPSGYLSGLLVILMYTTAGAIAGILWPLAIITAVFSIPAWTIVFLAKEKRKRRAFQKKLSKE